MKEWKKVKLGSLLTESKIASESPDVHKRITVKLNVQGVAKRSVTSDKVGATKYYVRSAGQFIYGRQNLHKGAFGIVPPELDGFESSADIPSFDVDDSCYPEWIFYFFKKGNFYLKLESLAKGVGSKRIQPSQIFNLDIFLPDKKVQKEILDRVALLEEKFNSLFQEIKKEEENLSKLRLVILEDGIQGKLTVDWREEDKNYKPANVILEEITEHKERLIENSFIKKEKKFPAIKSNEKPFEIPNNWIYVRLDDLASVVGGVTKGKKASSKMVTTPYLRVANVQRGFIDINDLKEILVSENDFQKYQLEINDLLIIEGGDRDKVGRGALWNNEIEGCIYQNHIFRLRPYNRQLTDVNFLLAVINSPTGRNYFEQNAKQTTNLASINKTVTRKFVLPLPPVEEQIAIADKIKSLLVICDKLDKEILLKKEKMNHSIQSFLVELLGIESNLILVNDKGNDQQSAKTQSRVAMYDSKTTLMELVELLKEHGKLHAEDLWRMSKHPDDIDAFYAELKQQIEIENTIKEVENEKGYLELA